MAPDHEPHEHERFERLREAALEAEFETGIREETVEQARAHILVRLVRITIGFLVVLLGLALVPLPGPGWLIVLGGLVILSKDFAWAERTIEIVRKRIPADADGRIHPRTWAAIGAMSAAGIAASVWWTVLR
ncbi:MAG TPA: PGPGW domain-containing protein [Acidimicrobiia bacterium]|nr:PGPGW domain-containing protein [Acidimicrobiia bacterium]